ncbi:ABC transporter ATP-binding protein [Alicyclobacillus mengziensis]|uniref:ABC transporter ATP-binding protein n=1 Tax=Alicyclobacillus mengziensis TaxID=2931921 RepID=A0A9X7VVU4_9BACL|nr:ABC transporter ATP-binding protein [Alicyclobacillus mengziensis]QSO45462.1 ABC transporter ATP-binding protein [Alicyclobacillus mengziensis]
MRLTNVIVRLSGKAVPSMRETVRYYKFFLPYAIRYWGAYLFLLVTLVLSVTMTLAYAWFLKNIVQDAVTHNIVGITWMVGFGIGFYFVNVTVNFFNTYVRTVTMNKVRKDLKTDLWTHLTCLPQSFYNRYQSGDLMSRLNNDTDVAVGAIGTNLVNIIRLPLTAGAAFVYLFGMNPKLSLILLCFGPIALVSATIFSRYIRINGRQIQNQLGKISGLVTEILAGHALVRAFSLQEFFSDKYEREMGKLLTLQTSSARLGGGFRIGAQVAGTAALLWCIGMGAYDVASGVMTAGSLLAFISLMNHLVSPFTGMAQQFGGLQRSMAATERLWEVLEQPAEAAILNAAGSLRGKEPKARALPYSLELRNVSFSYDGIRDAVHHITLAVPAGKIVALVGPSGAGKSTLFQLIMRFYNPASGEILMNNQPYGLLQAPDTRKCIAYVQQEPYLFSGSIRENILLGSLVASDLDVVRAAKQANIHDFVLSLPQGYETQVGEHGVRLSGGQKQRIAIARALLKDAPLLLFDEATSALDSESESLVQDALLRLMQSRTTLVIAHRLSTIQHADVIVVMNEGEIVEMGAHDDLLSRGGLYSRLHHLQSNGLHSGHQRVKA